MTDNDRKQVLSDLLACDACVLVTVHTIKKTSESTELVELRIHDKGMTKETVTIVLTKAAGLAIARNAAELLKPDCATELH